MFNPEIDDRTEECARASIEAALTEYDRYLSGVKGAELRSLLEAMAEAKTAYFAALTKLREKLQEISQEERTMTELMREYGVEGSVPSITVNKLTHPHHFISTYEIIADRALD